LRFRGFADVGLTTFSAHDSFAAVLGQDGGAVVGGGGEAVLRQRVFVGIRASRFRRTGERIFVHGRERFGLAEAQWATVPDALGGGSNSAAREFGESNLGGSTVRIKLIIGR
jgi:hypothetical protein